jgi:hypothetical protein
MIGKTWKLKLPGTANLMKTIILALLFISNSVFPQNLPQNSHKNSFDQNWECNKGFKRLGSECQKVQIPVNASLDFSGHDWECNKGFKRLGSECQKVQIPVNASLDFSGHDWECNKGFKRLGGECREMTGAEKTADSDRDKAVREEIKRRQVSGVRGNHCDSESISGANVCVTVKNSELNCSEAYDGTYYDGCQVELSIYVETDYRGRGYVDGRVKCEASVATIGASGYESNQTNDERWNFTLYPNDTSRRSIEIDFSFSSYDKIRKVRVSDVTCRVRDLYVY